MLTLKVLAHSQADALRDASRKSVVDLGRLGRGLMPLAERNGHHKDDGVASRARRAEQWLPPCPHLEKDVRDYAHKDVRLCYHETMSTFTRVLSSSEARLALPGLGLKIEREGILFKPVLFGKQRKAVGAIVSVELLEQLESLLEDMAVAPQVHERISAGAGEASMAQVAESLGLNPADFE